MAEQLTRTQKRNQRILKVAMLAVAAMFVLGSFASILYD